MSEQKFDTIIDFITGEEIPNIGAEENRQGVEKFLVNKKGFEKEDIKRDEDIEITIAGESYKSKTDLIVFVNEIRFMAIKCAAGSLGSWEREIIAASRLTDNKYQIPYSIVSDGENAVLLDTVSGKKIGEGMKFIPSKIEAQEKLKELNLQPFPKERIEKEKLIFRTYDSMNVNKIRN